MKSLDEILNDDCYATINSMAPYPVLSHKRWWTNCVIDGVLKVYTRILESHNKPIVYTVADYMHDIRYRMESCPILDYKGLQIGHNLIMKTFCNNAFDLPKRSLDRFLKHEIISFSKEIEITGLIGIGLSIIGGRSVKIIYTSDDSTAVILRLKF